MFGQLREQLAGDKRPAASLPSGRKSASKFAKLRPLVLQPAAPASALPPPPPRGEAAAGGEADGPSARTATRRAPPPVTLPYIAVFIGRDEALQYERDEEGAFSSSLELKAQQAETPTACIAFASDAEIAASRWFLILAPRPSALGPDAPQMPEPIDPRCLISAALAEHELDGLSECCDETRYVPYRLDEVSSGLLPVHLDGALFYSTNTAPVVLPPVQVRSPLALIRAELARDAREVAAPAAHGGGGRGSVEGGCPSVLSLASSLDCDVPLGTPLAYELEPRLSASAAQPRADDADSGTSAAADLQPWPLPSPRCLPPTQSEQGAFKFCVMDAAARASCAAELAGALELVEPFSADEIMLERDDGSYALSRDEGTAASAAASLGQFALARLGVVTYAGDDGCQYGEVLLQTSAALELHELYSRSSAHASRAASSFIDMPPVQRVGQSDLLCSGRDARRYVESWMAEDLREDGEARPSASAPRFPGLDLRETYRCSEYRLLVLPPTSSRLAMSDMAFESARQRLVGVSHTEQPISARERASENGWYVARALLERAGLSMPSSLSARDDETPYELEPPWAATNGAGGADAAELASCPSEVPPAAAEATMDEADQVQQQQQQQQPPPQQTQQTQQPHQPHQQQQQSQQQPVNLFAGAIDLSGDGECETTSAIPSRAGQGRLAAITRYDERTADGTAQQPAARLAQPPPASAKRVLDQEDFIRHFMQLRGQSGAQEEDEPDPPPTLRRPNAGTETVAEVTKSPPRLDVASTARAAPAVTIPPRLLQVCVGERAAQQNSAVVIGLASRGIRLVHRAFWSPCLAFDASTAAIVIDSAGLLEPSGTNDVIEELFALSSFYARCYLLVLCQAPRTGNAGSGDHTSELMLALSRVVVSARLLPIHAIPSLHNSPAELCAFIAGALEREASFAGPPSELVEVESQEECILSGFFNPIAVMHIIDAPPRERALASFLELDAAQRQERFPWLHASGLAALAALPQSANAPTRSPAY
ncbi:hypothetical protein T492DRAFT_868933 [Pavlovales sp. CCMP2436]|nr:hypothetical protein T492DRAFT_868933 [Pavlovales sp. CCMP2436]